MKNSSVFKNSNESNPFGFIYENKIDVYDLTQEIETHNKPIDAINTDYVDVFKWNVVANPQREINLINSVKPPIIPCLEHKPKSSVISSNNNKFIFSTQSIEFKIPNFEDDSSSSSDSDGEISDNGMNTNQSIEEKYLNLNDPNNSINNQLNRGENDESINENLSESSSDTEIELGSCSRGTCAVCLSVESFDNDPIIFCDGEVCNNAVHQSCYGLKQVPENEFYCEPCELRLNTKSADGIFPKCVLCFKRGGLLKRCLNNEWVHQICVLFTSELHLDDNMCFDGDLRLLNKDRHDLKCKICNVEGGACIQCHVKTCLESFHPYCAFESRYQMIVRSCKKDLFSYECYCRKHKDVKYDKSIVAARNSIRRIKKQTENNIKPLPLSVHNDRKHQIELSFSSDTHPEKIHRKRFL